MSRPVPESITCPECGFEHTTTVWDSLNAQANPAERDQLIDGSLFQHRCPQCGAVCMLNYSCLYSDPEHNVMVFYVPEASEVANVEGMFDGLRQRQMDEGEGMPMRLRIVRTQNQLREKAAIFDDELDDRVVELVKAVFRAYLITEQSMDVPHDGVFYTGVDEQGALVLYITGYEGEVGTVPMDFYEQVEQAYVLGRIEDDCYEVDSAWATRLVEDRAE